MKDLQVQPRIHRLRVVAEGLAKEVAIWQGKAHGLSLPEQRGYLA
jgi:hypothetical protein